MNDTNGANSTHPLRSTWPIHRRQVKQLLVGYLLITTVWIGIGWLLTGPLEHSALVREDQRLAQWMVAHRTPTWNAVTVWGSGIAATVTKVVVTAVLALVLLRVWKRWFEPVVLVVALVMEAAAFIVTTTVVDRRRPAVPRLEGSAVGSSFPSGHVAAAMTYATIAVIICWHTRKRWIRTVAAALSAVIPLIVALSRMYRGMHFLSDVVGGALLGGIAVLVTVHVLKRSPEGVQLTDQRANRAIAEPSASASASASEAERVMVGAKSIRV